MSAACGLAAADQNRLSWLFSQEQLLGFSVCLVAGPPIQSTQTCFFCILLRLGTGALRLACAWNPLQKREWGPELPDPSSFATERVCHDLNLFPALSNTRLVLVVAVWLGLCLVFSATKRPPRCQLGQTQSPLSDCWLGSATCTLYGHSGGLESVKFSTYDAKFQTGVQHLREVESYWGLQLDCFLQRERRGGGGASVGMSDSRASELRFCIP
ncbi:hypothetical protein OJ252_3382 [Cryptosporidium canis]|uniref:Uncharacterized protein n=1 Tax=Cryptosporidium canis TaxID=195482 RepID=A0ABQ8P2I4_9CRYT|nr:hypothetical protein OJ252_3382 [Cryptosporidium canis]